MHPRSIPSSRAFRRSAALAGVVALGAALCGCIGYDGDFDRGYQIDQQSLEQVKVGATTKPQALALMGTPSTTSTVGGDAWYYIGQKMSRPLAFMPAKMTDQNVLAIYFDKGGKVDRIANYGMKDGKVFDFVSRTTPTGGQEPDFLRNIMTGLFKFT
jgi:outer membrane protein assembly factor BamE (lipoprotein component of BamABCDE complex)